MSPPPRWARPAAIRNPGSLLAGEGQFPWSASSDCWWNALRCPRRAAGTGPVPCLDHGRAVWRQPVTGAQLAAEIARDAVRTFAVPTVERIRKCGSDNCYLTYLDTSRPGRRRWCSMQRCGNRHKVAEFRHRQTSQGEPS